MNPLENLQDIHKASDVSNWPPAYGWWILALAILLCVWFTSNLLIKLYKKRKIKRLALNELKAIRASENVSIMQLNQLLKRVTMAYFPNIAVQKLHGKQWAEFLISALPKNQASNLSSQISNMQNSLYQKPENQTANFDEHKIVAENWLKHALPPSHKTTKRLEQEHA